MSKKQKLEILNRLADNIPEEQKRKITNSVPANTLSKKIKKESLVALGTSATAGGVASAIIADNNLDAQKEDALKSAQRGKEISLSNLEKEKTKIESEFRKESKELGTTYKKIDDKIKNLEAEKIELEKSYEEAMKNRSDIYNSTEEIRGQIKDKNSEIQQLDRDLNGLKYELEKIDKEVENLDKKYVDNENFIKAKIEEEKKQIESLEGLNQRNEDNLKKIDVTSQQPKIDKLIADNEKNNELITVENEKITEYKSELEALQKLEGYQKELIEVNNKLNPLVREKALFQLNPFNIGKTFPKEQNILDLESAKEEIKNMMLDIDSDMDVLSGALFDNTGLLDIQLKIEEKNSDIKNSENSISG
jgi:chromosome segregation ATPase